MIRLRRAAVLLLISLLIRPPAAAGRDSEDGAPPFRIESVDGVTLDLAELRKRGPVLLDFWATWCKPCIQSLPEIQSLHERFGDRGLTVIGVSIDGPRNFARVRPFATRQKLTYPIVLDEDGGLQRDFKITAVPTAVLVDTSGVILWIRSGYRPGEGRKLAERIEARLPAPTGDE